MYHLGRVWKVRSFYVKVCTYLTKFGLFTICKSFTYLVYKKKRVIVYLQKIEWLAYIIVQFIT